MEFVNCDNFNGSLDSKDSELIFSNVQTREHVKDGLRTCGRIVHKKDILEINRKVARVVNLIGFIFKQFNGNQLREIILSWSTGIIHNSVNECLMRLKIWTGEEIIIHAIDVIVHNTLTYKRYGETIIHDDKGNVYWHA